MQMLYRFSGSIQQYIEQIRSDEEANGTRPTRCPQCESKQALVCHGFYKRTVTDVDCDCVIRVRRFLCSACRRTVSLLPEFALPYLRFTIMVIGAFLKARLLFGQTMKGAAESAHQSVMPYQRGQQWVRRFRRQAESVSAALAALVRPIGAPDFVTRAIHILGKTGWVQAHRFLFEHLRQALLGWSEVFAPAALPATVTKANPPLRTEQHRTFMGSGLC